MTDAFEVADAEAERGSGADSVTVGDRSESDTRGAQPEPEPASGPAPDDSAFTFEAAETDGTSSVSADGGVAREADVDDGNAEE